VPTCWGIDVGAKALHCVGLDEDYHLVDCGIFEATDVDQLCERMDGAEAVAIDAPAELSTMPHVDDPDPKLSPKFRAARCAEVALGRKHGYWVPFVTPSQEPNAWMKVGLDLHAAARTQVTEKVIEVYPYACFRELAGGASLPKKNSVVGQAHRVKLLKSFGFQPPGVSMWSHDALDAAVAAVTAVRHHASEAVRVACESSSNCLHDSSAIWLPVSP
jgi:predicted nuclease with RNAse H fold